MPTTTLKALCDSVLGETGFLIPAAYVSGQPDDLQMVYVATAAADEIREKMPQIIRRTFTVTLTVATTYALPADFLGYVPDTAFIDGRLDPVRLPTSAAEWQAWLASNSPQGIEIRARFLNGSIQIIEPPVGSVLRFEYFSSYPWLSGAALGPQVGREVPIADSDECVFDRRLMIAGIKWRWKKEKGLPDWDVDFNEYTKMVNTFRGRDQGARTIQFGETMHGYCEPYANLWVQ
jgi:hypothetical protein